MSTSVQINHQGVLKVSTLWHFKMNSRNKSCLKLFVRAGLLIILLVSFFKVYFVDQVTDFAKGLSTVTTTYEYPNTIEPPTMILCFNEAFKTSVGKAYQINSTYDVADPKSNFSYDEVIYQLDRDFEIMVGSIYLDGDMTINNYVNLHKGLNTLKHNDEEYVFLVDFVQTYFSSRCTKITPQFEFSQFPFNLLSIKVILKTENTEDHPTGLKLYLTSNDTWQGILWDSWETFQPTILEFDFEETFNRKVVLLSPIKLLFKDGVHSQSKCIGKA